MLGEHNRMMKKILERSAGDDSEEIRMMMEEEYNLPSEFKKKSSERKSRNLSEDSG